MNQLKSVMHSFKTSEKHASVLAARVKRAKMTKTSYIMYKLGLDKPEERVK